MDKSFWFVLTCESLSWYKDDQLRERHYSIPLDGRLRTRFSPKNARSFYLIPEDRKKNIYKTYTELELIAATQEEMEEWMVKLVDVGIYIQNEDGETAKDEGLPEDPHLKWQVETIYVIVDSYLRVVRQNLQDLVPKAVVHTVIHRMSKYLDQKLIADICRRDVSQLMGEDPAAIERRQKLQRHLASCERALDIISKVDVGKPLVDPNFDPTRAALVQRRQPPPARPAPALAPRPVSRGPDRPRVPTRPAPPPKSSSATGLAQNDRKMSEPMVPRRADKQNSSLRFMSKKSDVSVTGSKFYVD